MDESVKLYTSAFRLSDAVRSAVTIFSTYEKVYGQGFDLSSTTLHTIRSYASNELGKAFNYSTGGKHVKNFVCVFSWFF